MSSDSYRTALAEAKAAHERAKQRVLDADVELLAAQAELSDLRRVIRALSIMCGEEPDPEVTGLTQTVRAVMTSAVYAMTLAEVRLAVSGYGFDWGTHQNPDASLSAILRRLRDAKQIKHRVILVADKSGRKRKQVVWIGPLAVADMPKDQFMKSMQRRRERHRREEKRRGEGER